VKIIDMKSLVPALKPFYLIAQETPRVNPADELEAIKAMGIEGVAIAPCGVYDRREDAEAVREYLAKKYPGHELWVASSLGATGIP
jgi:hypothetical protein